MHLRRTHLVLALLAALVAPVTASADKTFTFTGHGYGHGVGMPQYGAEGYALAGGTLPADPRALLPGHDARPDAAERPDPRAAAERSAERPGLERAGGLVAHDERAAPTVDVPSTAVVDAVGRRRLRRRRRRRRPARRRLGRAGAASPAGGEPRRRSPEPRSTAARTASTAAPSASSQGSTGSPPSTSCRSRTTCAASCRARCRRPGSPPRSRRRRSPRAATPSRPLRRRPGSSTSTPTRARRPTRGMLAEKPETDAAIAATSGQILTYAGKTAVTYFSSSSGGRTANVQEVFPNAQPTPYLVAVDDPYDAASPVPRLDAHADRQPDRPGARLRRHGHARSRSTRSPRGACARSCSTAARDRRSCPAGTARTRARAALDLVHDGTPARPRRRRRSRRSALTLARPRVRGRACCCRAPRRPAPVQLQGANGASWRDARDRHAGGRRHGALHPPARRDAALPPLPGPDGDAGGARLGRSGLVLRRAGARASAAGSSRCSRAAPSCCSAPAPTAGRGSRAARPTRRAASR